MANRIFFSSSNIYQAVYRVAAANAAALAIAIRLCMGERCFGPQVNAILLGPIIYIGHFSLWYDYDALALCVCGVCVSINRTNELNVTEDARIWLQILNIIVYANKSIVGNCGAKIDSLEAKGVAYFSARCCCCICVWCMRFFFSYGMGNGNMIIWLCSHRAFFFYGWLKIAILAWIWNK